MYKGLKFVFDVKLISVNIKNYNLIYVDYLYNLIKFWIFIWYEVEIN